MYASELFLYTWGWRENSFSLDTHGHPIFPEAGGRPDAYLCFHFFKQKIKTFNQNCSEERASSKNPHKHFWLWDNFRETWRKILQRLKQWWAWKIELIACYITVRIPPNSLISPACCILQVCAPARVYKRGGGAFLTFCFILFLFYCRQNTYVIGDGNNACILVRNLS